MLTANTVAGIQLLMVASDRQTDTYSDDLVAHLRTYCRALRNSMYLE